VVSGKLHFWHPSISVVFFYNVNRASFLALIEHAAHTQRDSPGGSTPCGQRTFPSECYETDILVM